jgi:hypothetical protein
MSIYAAAQELIRHFFHSYKDLAPMEHIPLGDLCALLFNSESGPAALFYCTRYPLKTAESHKTCLTVLSGSVRSLPDPQIRVRPDILLTDLTQLKTDQ